MIITGTYSTVGAVETLNSLEARVEWAQPASQPDYTPLEYGFARRKRG
jgi:hypothetical protein